MEQINDDVRNIMNNRHINLEEGGGGGDYVDKLLPGYRFCPTDSELIRYYLIPKIETGNYPPCRLYQVNLYDHSPDELAERYRGCDGKWYFLTSRERKYQKGDRPNRRTRDGGYWKTTKIYTFVYVNDDSRQQTVGTKRNLVYYEKNDRKTEWLMHEYTTNDPNNPVGTTDEHNGSNKLTNWVLCKIYKKETKQSDDNQSLNTNNEEQNLQQSDEQRPSQRRRRSSVSTQPQHIQIQEANHHAATNIMNNQMRPNEIGQLMWDSNQQSDHDIMIRSIVHDVYPNNDQTSTANEGSFVSSFMNQVTYPISVQPPMFQASSSTQPTIEAHDPLPYHQMFATESVDQYSVRNSTREFEENRPAVSTPTSSFRYSEGASSSSSILLEQPLFETDAHAAAFQNFSPSDWLLLDELLSSPIA